jgi:predicted hydrocarbon binding protein
MQLAEYEGLVRKNARVGRSHVEALLRLVGRRPDAELVFSEAGRRAARRGVAKLGLFSRVGTNAAPRALGFRAARGIARRVLGADLHKDAQIPVASVADTLALVATPDGSACTFYGAALAELLRLLVGLEVAMVHTSCRANGGVHCEWRAAAADPWHS